MRSEVHGRRFAKLSRLIADKTLLKLRRLSFSIQILGVITHAKSIPAVARDWKLKLVDSETTADSDQSASSACLLEKCCVVPPQHALKLCMRTKALTQLLALGLDN